MRMRACGHAVVEVEPHPFEILGCSLSLTHAAGLERLFSAAERRKPAFYCEKEVAVRFYNRAASRPMKPQRLLAREGEPALGLEVVHHA